MKELEEVSKAPFWSSACVPYYVGTRQQRTILEGLGPHGAWRNGESACLLVLPELRSVKRL